MLCLCPDTCASGSRVLAEMHTMRKWKLLYNAHDSMLSCKTNLPAQFAAHCPSQVLQASLRVFSGTRYTWSLDQCVAWMMHDLSPSTHRVVPLLKYCMGLSRPWVAFIFILTEYASPQMGSQHWPDRCSHWVQTSDLYFLLSGLENRIGHMEALDKCTFKALNDSQNSSTLSNTVMTQSHKAVLQATMASEVLKAARGTCVIIKAEYCPHSRQ